MDYGINDIKSLSFKDAVRTRVQMYLGSDDLDGTYQAFKEIINNSTDEAIAGYGNKIEIYVNETENYIAVRDYGRGVPFGIREDGENVLISIYSKSHTGGKFEEGPYKNASGLNGIGAKCVCLSSEKFEVQSNRNGKTACAFFEKGNLINYREGTTKEPDGTYVRFKPDKEVFKTGKIGYSYKKICEDIKDISYLYSGIKFVIKNDETNEVQTYCAKNGIIDFVKDTIKKPLHKHIIYNSVVDTNGDKVEIAFQWGDGKEESYVFVNGLRCPEGGSPITGAKSAITRTFNSLSKSSFDGDSIRGGLFYVINCSVAQPSFANQTKSKINNTNLRTLASNAFSDALKQMKLKYSNEFDDIVEMMKKIERAEKAAEKARQQILNAVKDVEKNQKKKVFASDKLKDAEFLGENSTLLLVEGLSAASSVAMARDEKKFGILALRGKPINAFSNDDEKFYQNEEIKLLLSAMNIVPGKYDSKKLRYGKIGILSDADADGYAIGLLIMCALYKVAPQFITEGRLYWMRSPLYIIKNGKSESYFYTDEEFNAARGKIKGEVTRAKGLGALSPEQARTSMFTSEYQRFEQLIPDDSTLDLLNQLMGKDSTPKYNFIFENIDFSQIME